MNAAIKPQIMDLHKKPDIGSTSSLPVAMGYSAYVEAINMLKNNTPYYQLSFNNTTVSAVAADSLLVCPEVGDLVLCIEVDHQLFVSQVLKQARQKDSLVIESSRPIEWVAPVLRFKALKEMELLSVNKLTISACDLICGASRTLLQQASHFIQNAKTYSLTTKGLMRLTGKQQVIIAEEDMRMDAKRINMG